MIPDTAILISNFNRRNFLKNTLDSLYKTIPKGTTVLVVDDCSTDNPKEILKDYPDLIFHQFEENKGLRAVVSWGIDFLTNLPMKYICYMENDVLLKEGWLEACKYVWSEMNKDEVNPCGFVTCHNSPEHPCPEETKKAQKITLAQAGFNEPEKHFEIIVKPTERSTHLFASVERWKLFGKIPTERPTEQGGSQIDWWLMGHPTKYEQSEHSLRKENEWVAVIPGYCYHVGNISSTYRKPPMPEIDDFVNLIFPYMDTRNDVCFQFNPPLPENTKNISTIKQFWNLPNKKIGALYMSCNEDMYIMQSLLSVQRLVDFIVIADNSSTDRTLEMIEKFKALKDSPPVFVFNMPKDGCEIIGYNTLLGSHISGGIDAMNVYFHEKCDWMIQMEPDLVLYEMPDDTLRKTATYLEMRGFNCLNIFMRDFVYDYAHLNAQDWGEGVSNFYSERRFFKVTPTTGYAAWNYLCPRNEGSNVPTYYRFWNEWNGLVAKSRFIKFAHYGFCRGVERIRMRSYFKCSAPFIFWDEKGFKEPDWLPYDDINHNKQTTYQIPTIIFKGKHPKYMCVD